MDKISVQRAEERLGIFLPRAGEGMGSRQRSELRDEIRDAGQAPVVIVSADIRRDPEGFLRRLCAAIGLAYDPAMLGQPAGGHAQDGVWAPHWQASVHRPTGFAGP